MLLKMRLCMFDLGNLSTDQVHITCPSIKKTLCLRFGRQKESRLFSVHVARHCFSLLAAFFSLVPIF